MGMASTKLQILVATTGAALLALIGLTILSIWKNQTLSLPIPTAVIATSLLPPILSGLSLFLRTNSATNNGRYISFSRSKRRANSFRVHPNQLQLIITILVTSLASLIGPYIAPVSGLTCGLDTRWQDLFRSKNEDAIRRVQDALKCCGLRSTVDRAWPFPKSDKIFKDTCEILTGRTQSCFELWRGRERGIAGIVLAVLIVNLVLEFIVLRYVSRVVEHQTSEEGLEVVSDDDDHGRYRDNDFGARAIEGTSSEPAARPQNSGRLIEGDLLGEENEWARQES